MNSKLIDHLLSSYGLIQGDLTKVVDELSYQKITKDSQFEVDSKVTDFNEMIEFLSELEDTPNKHAIFEHSPGWLIMLSNSRNLDSYSKYQKSISAALKTKTIRIIDVEQGVDQNKIHVFSMLSELGEILREVYLINKDKKIKFSDSGNYFKNFEFKDKQFNSNNISELVREATKYDLTLGTKNEKKFILIKETTETDY